MNTLSSNTPFSLILFYLHIHHMDIISGRKPPEVRKDSPFTEKFFTQTLDHFNFNSFGNGTFCQRYLISDKFWQNGSGPVFFYTGNEGDISDFALNSGFILELAEQQGALVIFAEHRYYGASLPFGKDSFSRPLVGLLTVEQALADYAVMITELKQQLQADNCPVIVFGAQVSQHRDRSAGGQRPHPVHAGVGDPRQFFRDVTADYEAVSPQCSAAVRAAPAAPGLSQYRRIQSAFALCQPPSAPRDIHQLNGLLRNAFTFMAMLDYPYSTHFMGNMPAHPSRISLRTMFLSLSLSLAAIVYNSSTPLSCFDLYNLYVECADPTGCGLGPNSLAWDYQACTEVELCFESNNVTDMFPPMSFSQADRRRYCSERGVTPRPGWLRLQFWGDATSFSNGDLDPWANGGVRRSLSSSLIAINIPEGAHHLDLRGANEEDPESVVRARKQEAELIAGWIQGEKQTKH
uniref:Dipeptidyl peptidase 7 n=1 Tax=Salarias fasciatus TaxID=181472 RepID=A0A672GF81_SALFA